jgi:hypothetical protein
VFSLYTQFLSCYLGHAFASAVYDFKIKALLFLHDDDDDSNNNNNNNNNRYL